MTSSEKQHLWERDLKQEIYGANAVLRRTGIYSGSELNFENVRREAVKLGIDPDRAWRIAVAAKSDFDWAEAVDDMVREGIPQEAAEAIAEKISAKLSVTRFLADNFLKRYWDRIESRLYWVGMASLAAVVSLVVVYWSPIWITVGSVVRCLMGGGMS